MLGQIKCPKVERDAILLYVFPFIQVLQDERDPEVRRMNEWILQAKCHAIRDQQMAEKERRL